MSEKLICPSCGEEFDAEDQVLAACDDGEIIICQGCGQPDALPVDVGKGTGNGLRHGTSKKVEAR